MKKNEKLKKKFNRFLYDHLVFKDGLSFAKSMVYSIVAAFLYAIGFVCFITPGNFEEGKEIVNLVVVTGGVGGVAQNIALIFDMCGIKIDAETMQSIFYFVVNVPIVIFAYITIGKRFSILTVINVGLSSLFIYLCKSWQFVFDVRAALQDQMLIRILLSAIFVGLASAIGFKGDLSCGGIDVFSYYFALRKSTSVGKYATAINVGIMTVYTVMLGCKTSDWPTSFLSFLYSVIYLVVIMLLVDAINIRNKKVQIQIITNRDDMSSILISQFPHGSTICKGEGGYSGNDRYVVFMIVSSFEVKQVVSLAKKVDDHAFIAVTNLNQVYGNFFIAPVE